MHTARVHGARYVCEFFKPLEQPFKFYGGGGTHTLSSRYRICKVCESFKSIIEVNQWSFEGKHLQQALTGISQKQRWNKPNSTYTSEEYEKQRLPTIKDQAALFKYLKLSFSPAIF